MTDTNIYARKQIGRRWPKLSDDEQQQLRSLWARSGVSCEICGLVGYYREICPKKCQLPKKRRRGFDSDSDSDDDDEKTAKVAGSTVTKPSGVEARPNVSKANDQSKGYVNDTGLGILWGNVGTLASSDTVKRPKIVCGSSLSHKQQYLAGKYAQTHNTRGGEREDEGGHRTDGGLLFLLIVTSSTFDAPSPHIS